MKQELDIKSVERGERQKLQNQGAPRRSGSSGAVDWKLDLWTLGPFDVDTIKRLKWFC